MNSSYVCKNNCIDQNKTFCPSADHRSGKCYGPGETPISVSSNGCSNNIQSGDYSMMYWYCDYNVNCTNNYMV